MKASSGEHYIALDHVRAVACFMVFTWHFTHGMAGHPIPFEYVPAFFPFSLIDEGHTGVALFMTLSGYLFAKLLDGRAVRYGRFLCNRALRLVPLLALVILIVGIQLGIHGEPLGSYLNAVLWGLVFPTLPNGGWSITVELHFYLVLPLLLWLLGRSRWLPVLIVLGALALRVLLYQERGEIQSLAYGTIVGRIDQFVLGMVMYHFRRSLAHRHVAVALTLITFAVYYWFFDLQGGFYRNPSYPSPSPLWIAHTTIEALAYAIAIAWYDSSFAPSNRGASRFLGLIGTYSYSIYLLHFFFVFDASRFVHQHVMDISNFYLACIWSIGCFLLMVPIGHLSFRLVESPFLKLRQRYTAERTAAGSAPGPPAPSTTPRLGTD